MFEEKPIAGEGIGWESAEREHARNHPDDYPSALKAGLSETLRYLKERQQQNYDNPEWEPAIGFIERAVKELG